MVGEDQMSLLVAYSIILPQLGITKVYGHFDCKTVWKYYILSTKKEERVTDDEINWGAFMVVDVGIGGERRNYMGNLTHWEKK